MEENKQFERAIRKHIDHFLSPKKKPRKPQVATTKGLTVILAVRMKTIAHNEEFVCHTNSISKLQARIDAERAARAAGWKQIAYVIDYLSD